MMNIKIKVKKKKKKMYETFPVPFIKWQLNVLGPFHNSNIQIIQDLLSPEIWLGYGPHKFLFSVNLQAK